MELWIMDSNEYFFFSHKKFHLLPMHAHPSESEAPIILWVIIGLASLTAASFPADKTSARLDNQVCYCLSLIDLRLQDMMLKEGIRE